MDLAHLRPETRQLVELPAAERLARMPANRWIGYSRARAGHSRRSGSMLEREPGRIRPRNLLIVGRPTTARRQLPSASCAITRHAHPRTASTSHSGSDGPDAASAHSEPAVCAPSLPALVCPALCTARSPDREGAALYLLRQVDCRMLVLDELHNLLAAPIPRQRELLNLLRYLGNELRIPLACLGTREAYLAIRTTTSWKTASSRSCCPSGRTDRSSAACSPASRQCCRYASLPAWGCQRCAHMILQRSEGTVGEVAALLAAATAVRSCAARSGSLDCGWIRPSISRRPCAGACSNASCDERHSRDDPSPARRWPLASAADRLGRTWRTGFAGSPRRYGVSYDAFLLNALGHTGQGARDLDQAPAWVIARLSAGTGVPIERLLAMRSSQILTRAFRQAPALRETPQGQATLEGIEAVASRQRRRRAAARGF